LHEKVEPVVKENLTTEDGFIMTEEQQRVFDKDMSQKETDLVIDRNLLEK
jgi:hypothetical protein